MSTTLYRMQGLLEGIYDLRPGFDVRDFLITNPQLAAALAPTARDTPERVLVLEEGDTLSLSLYLDPALIQRLHRDDPIDCLHPGNFADFVTAMEGLSHFLFLAWSASHDRPTSQLELETQAEIDKFIASVFVSELQDDGHKPDQLHAQLFLDPRFDPLLGREERDRYRGASRLAGRYCHALLSNYMSVTKRSGSGVAAGHHSRANLLRELRRFYRLGTRRKLCRLDRPVMQH